MENTGEQIPKALIDISKYVLNLEKKYFVLAKVLDDLFDVKEDMGFKEAIEHIYYEMAEDVPEEIREMIG